ncbi:STAS domain-containing protein [Jeotgalibacillus proteolyticus]|uniref:STAS domain-containing protein n=1 Tax=Jeotgalibacillus proteolyticus TaxID=2082395 RepID=A0A2S5G696_9BACL|nr:STAS domain-containing protein [Jeotgalibacillus proteolyticus]PPA68502.1 hypothetical protein C4B60_20890 [Jeotgalibacillus proteolyticus]
MSKLTPVATYLADHAEPLAEQLIAFSLKKIEIEVPEALVEKSRQLHISFFTFFSQSILLPSEKEAEEQFVQFTKGQQYEQKYVFDQLSTLIKPFAETRSFYNKIVTDICLNFELAVEDILFVANRLNYLLDLRLTNSILDYESYKDEIARRNREEIIELAAPIVPLKSGMAILPLIGSIDQERAEHLLSKAVPKLSTMEVNCLIIDFSGIYKIDNEVASHIFSLLEVLKLLGIDATVTGLRPELAQSIVLSGIDFTGVKTFSSVMQALDA